MPHATLFPHPSLPPFIHFKQRLTLKFKTEPASALTEAPPSSANDADTDFSDKLVAAEAVSLLMLKRWADETST